MRFQVPQFIETETSIVGPLTLRQFSWLLIGTMLLFLAFVVFPFYVFIIVALIISPLFVALAFMKVSGLPLYVYLSRYVSYLMNPKKYKYKR